MLEPTRFIIDGIIEEPVGGAHRDHQAIACSVKESILADLQQLQQFDAAALLRRRRERLLSIGQFAQRDF